MVRARQLTVFAVLATLTLVLVGCGSDADDSGSPGEATTTTESPDTEAPLTLLVGNQSAADTTVGITVTVDGKVVVDQDIEYEDPLVWEEFPLDLEPGQHLLEATSTTGATFSEQIEIPADGPRWASLDYGHDPDSPVGPNFSLLVSEYPLGDL